MEKRKQRKTAKNQTNKWLKRQNSTKLKKINNEKNIKKIIIMNKKKVGKVNENVEKGRNEGRAVNYVKRGGDKSVRLSINQSISQSINHHYYYEHNHHNFDEWFRRGKGWGVLERKQQQNEKENVNEFFCKRRWRWTL